MTMKEALENRIPRIRKNTWFDPNCYIRLPLFEKNQYGPWAELYSEKEQLEILNIRPGSQRILTFQDNDNDYVEYNGPISNYEQHKDNYSSIYLEK